MKERPILFSGPMVRAILDGRKTQTRRVVRPDWLACLTGDCPHQKQSECEKEIASLCPFGQSGDRLWVRETFYCDDFTRGDYALARKYSRPEPSDEYIEARWREATIYRADGEWPHQIEEGGRSEWRPSIHMPRWASRITLEVTGVRVERVQECSGQDAIAEGVKRAGDGYYLGGPHPVKGTSKCFSLAWQAYKDIWNNRNAKRGYGWDVNPWVWVVEFKQIESNHSKALALNAYGGRQM